MRHLPFLNRMLGTNLRAIDQPDSAASLLSVNFSKAFNRMGHAECITALSICGASMESLQMVVAFFCGRRMRFKVNGTFSNERDMNGGSPQGTRLGNFLFITTIKTIEKSLNHLPPSPLLHKSTKTRKTTVCLACDCSPEE